MRVILAEAKLDAGEFIGEDGVPGGTEARYSMSIGKGFRIIEKGRETDTSADQGDV
jgi:hypothetical protein